MEDDAAAYAAVSGDRNPVHIDDVVAREMGGFQRGRVVHGMLVASLFPSIIAARFVRTLPSSFSPLWHSIKHHVSVETHSVGVALWLRLMVGSAWSGVRESDAQVCSAGVHRR